MNEWVGGWTDGWMDMGCRGGGSVSGRDSKFVFARRGTVQPPEQEGTVLFLHPSARLCSVLPTHSNLSLSVGVLMHALFNCSTD